jgi:hypothetical protein
MGLVKCLAKRSLAYREGPTQRRNMKRLVRISERQRFGPLDKIVTGPVRLLGSYFRHSCDPPMDCHRKPPCREPAKQARLGATQHRGRPGDIVLWGRPGVAQWNAASEVDIPLYGVAPGEGVVVNNPTRSAMETASAND